jgi:hypothetical protein
MEDGTVIAAYDEIASIFNTELSGLNHTGLGCWSFMAFTGAYGHLTTVLVGYNTFKNSRSLSSTSYQLQRSFFTLTAKDTIYSRMHFLTDLSALLAT